MNKIRAVLIAVMVSAIVSCGGGGGGSSSDSCGHVRVAGGESCSQDGSAIVKLSVNRTDGPFLCSGTLIASDYVLTAAHCTPLGKVISIEVENGNSSVSGDRFVIHASQALDQSVVHLSTPLAGKTLPVFCSNRPQSIVGKAVEAFGYGLDEEHNLGGLKRAVMTATSAGSIGFLATSLDSTSFTCKGDSGGPAVIATNSTYAVAGLVSIGTNLDCGTVSGVTGFVYPDCAFISRYAPSAGLVS